VKSWQRREMKERNEKLTRVSRFDFVRGIRVVIDENQERLRLEKDRQLKEFLESEETRKRETLSAPQLEFQF